MIPERLKGLLNKNTLLGFSSAAVVAQWVCARLISRHPHMYVEIQKEALLIILKQGVIDGTSLR